MYVHVQCIYRGKEKKGDQIPLALEFLMLLDHHVCVVNQILVLYKNSKCP